MVRSALLATFALSAASAQTICPSTPTWSVCEISVPASAAAELSGEFRSPGHHTYLIPSFRDGSKLVLRIAPTEPGSWDFRLSDGKTGQFTATASDAPGFIEAANVHHFRYTGNRQPHLWMGDIAPATLDGAAFDSYADARARQHFNHIRLTLMPAKPAAFPDEAWFAAVDRRVLAINRRGMTADLVIAPGNNAFTQWFPERAQRERAVKYLVARYGAMNITWMGLENFETYDRGRELMNEIAGVIEAADQYHHMQSCGTTATSAPLLDAEWMKFLTYRSPDPQIADVEHQVFAAPAVGDFRGAGNTADAFRRDLWHAAMAGEYPESAPPDETAAAQMKVWYDFFATTRHWELEPFYNLDGGTGYALEDLEYIVYVDKPGPVSVQVIKHNYEVEWLNPINGEIVREKKNLKEETFSGEPPDKSHDWVLHLSREGEKASRLRSYKFESHEVLMQEVESNPAKVPFEIVQPSADTLSLAHPPAFEVRITKQTRGTRRMEYVWTGEVTADEQSYRVIGTGPQGTFQIPANLAIRFPALLHVHVTALNANGKAYALDRNYQLTP